MYTISADLHEHYIFELMEEAGRFLALQNPKEFTNLVFLVQTKPSTATHHKVHVKTNYFKLADHIGSVWKSPVQTVTPQSQMTEESKVEV